MGACVCGAVEFECTGLPLFTTFCHCSQCRRAFSTDYACLHGFSNIQYTKGADNLSAYATGAESRDSCKTCNSKLKISKGPLQMLISTMLTNPNHGANGKIDPRFKPTCHIFYTSGTVSVFDGLPKFVGMPAAFGGRDDRVPEDYHAKRYLIKQDGEAKEEIFEASCLCKACKVQAQGAPKWTVCCHCSQCRRAAASDYLTLCGFDEGSVKVVEGEDNLVPYKTGNDERFSCKTCGVKVFTVLHHLKHRCIMSQAFTTPNHGPDGIVDERFKPSMHIFYTSGLRSIYDGLPKWETLPAAFGGADKAVAENYHDT